MGKVGNGKKERQEGEGWGKRGGEERSSNPTIKFWLPLLPI